MKKGYVWILLGILCLLAALGIVAYNRIDDERAGNASGEVLVKLKDVVREEREHEPIPVGDSGGSPSSSSAADLPSEPASSGKASDPYDTPEVILPDYVVDPGMEMPETEIDGRRYVGVLSIPSLDLELPVQSGWDYKKLKISPCRYVGTPYLGNFVIASHNYDRHFGRLKQLSPHDAVFFTDMNGNLFSYEVAEVLILPPNAVGEMKSGEYPLTLFTCTIGGRTRVTVRCREMTERSK